MLSSFHFSFTTYLKRGAIWRYPLKYVVCFVHGFGSICHFRKQPQGVFWFGWFVWINWTLNQNFMGYKTNHQLENYMKQQETSSTFLKNDHYNRKNRIWRSDYICFSGTTLDIFGLGDSYYLNEHSIKNYSGIQKSHFRKQPHWVFWFGWFVWIIWTLNQNFMGYKTNHQLENYMKQQETSSTFLKNDQYNWKKRIWRSDYISFSGKTPDIFGLGDSYYLNEHSIKNYSGIQKSTIFEE